jgi:hypothetical protein
MQSSHRSGERRLLVTRREQIILDSIIRVTSSLLELRKRGSRLTRDQGEATQLILFWPLNRCDSIRPRYFRGQDERRE